MTSEFQDSFHLRIFRWVESGCSPRSENAPAYDYITSMENDGLLLRSNPNNINEELLWTISALGHYEFERLKETEEKAR